MGTDAQRGAVARTTADGSIVASQAQLRGQHTHQASLSIPLMGRSADGEFVDCLECRMIGTGAMLSFSGYFAYLAHGVKPTAVHERRFSLLCSVGFAAAGAYRWFMV